MRDRLSILYTAYPLLTVTPESAGGAEQMRLTLECETAAAVIERPLAACRLAASVSGCSRPGEPADAPDQFERREREHTPAFSTT